MSDIEAFISERIAAGDPLFEGDRKHRAREYWMQLTDKLYPYACLTLGLRALHGQDVPDVISFLDETPEVRAAFEASQ